jgi:hypothetical protein
MMATLSEFCDEPKRFVTITHGYGRYGPKRAVVVNPQAGERPRRRHAACAGEGSRAIAFSILPANGNVRIRVRAAAHVIATAKAPLKADRGVLSRAL